MEKTLEEKIFELKEMIKRIIGESNLNVSIVEMIIHEIYLDVKELSAQNLRRIVSSRQINDAKEDEDEHNRQDWVINYISKHHTNEDGYSRPGHKDR